MEKTHSENKFSENTLLENKLSENTLSENTLYEIHFEKTITFGKYTIHKYTTAICGAGDSTASKK